MLRLLAFLTVVGLALSASIPGDQLQRLERLIIELLDEKETHVADDNQLATVEMAVGAVKQRSASLVQEDFGEIKVTPQFDTSPGGPDESCKPDNTCWFSVSIYNNDDAKYEAKLVFQYDGINGVTFENLPSNGQTFTVETCRVTSDTDETVIDNRCSCHQCPASEDMPSVYQLFGMCGALEDYTFGDECRI